MYPLLRLEKIEDASKLLNEVKEAIPMVTGLNRDRYKFERRIENILGGNDFTCIKTDNT